MISNAIKSSFVYAINCIPFHLFGSQVAKDHVKNDHVRMDIENCIQELEVRSQVKVTATAAHNGSYKCYWQKMDVHH